MECDVRAAAAPTAPADDGLDGLTMGGDWERRFDDSPEAEDES